jgi:hypothetical protein
LTSAHHEDPDLEMSLMHAHTDLVADEQRELANLCLHTIDAVGPLKSMQRRPQLIAAFWQQAELPI